MSQTPASTNGFTRRALLRMGFGLGAALMIAPKTVLAAPAPQSRRLTIHNVATNESFDDVYWSNGAYVPKALSDLNVLMRDHRAESVTRMDPELFDVLHQLQMALGRGDEPMQLISAYRTPATNAAKRRRSRRVAKNSMHMYGKAADIRIPGHSFKELFHAAVDLHAGGVGKYRRDGFVHVDTGPLRVW